MSTSGDRAPWLVAWLRERVVASLVLFASLALAVALAGGERRVAGRALVALVALTALRLWDDLEDLPHDRRHHPERVLCRLASLEGPREWALAALAVATALVVAIGGSPLPFASAVAALFGIYRARSRLDHASLRPLFAHAILLKVPALALALAGAGAPWPATIGRALVLYGASCLYEIAHDRDTRASPLAPCLASLDVACLLAGSAIWLLSRAH